MEKCIQSRKVGILFEENIPNSVKSNLHDHLNDCEICGGAYTQYRDYFTFVDRHIPKFELSQDQIDLLKEEVMLIGKEFEKKKVLERTGVLGQLKSKFQKIGREVLILNSIIILTVTVILVMN